MDGLKQSGGFEVPAAALAHIRRAFHAATTGEAETAATMKWTLGGSGYLLDPHSAVGVSVANSVFDPASPMVTLATAHPAKFPAAVKAATGIEPALPAGLADLFARPERFTVLPNNVDAIATFISARARAGKES